MSLSVEGARELYISLCTAGCSCSITANGLPRYGIAVVSPILPVGGVVEEDVVVEHNRLTFETLWSTGLRICIAHIFITVHAHIFCPCDGVLAVHSHSQTTQLCRCLDMESGGELIVERGEVVYKTCVFEPLGIERHVFSDHSVFEVEELLQCFIPIPAGKHHTVLLGAGWSLNERSLGDFSCDDSRATITFEGNGHPGRIVSRRIDSRILPFAPFPVVQLQFVVVGMGCVPSGNGIVIGIDALLRL